VAREGFLKDKRGPRAKTFEHHCHKAMVLELFVAVDPFHCTQNRCGALRFVKVFLINGKLDLAVC